MNRDVDERAGFWLVVAGLLLALGAALATSCAPIDPKCCLGIPCYRSPVDAGP